MKRRIPVAALALGVWLCAASALAVLPASWNHTTEADFSSGKLDHTVTTSLGQVLLAREVKILVRSDSAPTVVSAVAVAGRTLYAAAGNEPVVYRLQGDKAVKFAELPCTMVGCLLWTGGELLAGTGGDKAGIYRLDNRGKAQPLWTDEKVKYVWAVLRKADGGFYAATGPEGKVFAIDKAGKGQVVYQAEKLAKNILCLAAAPGGKLYAGTDENGLILELDPKARTGRVLYDAPEKEIAALLVGDDGELFAATSDASKASADGAKAPATTREGKADKGRAPATKPKAAWDKPATKPAPTKPEPPKPEPTKPEPPKPAKPDEKPEQKPKDADKPDKDKPKDDKQPDGKPKEAPEAPEGDASGKAIVASGRAVTTAPSKAPPTRPAGLKVPPRPAQARGPIRIVRPSGPPSTPSAPPAGPPPTGPGNAVYIVRSDGLVDTIFRRPVTILAMLRQDDKLLLGTGNGGGIYSVTLDGDEIALIADTDAKQVTSLAAASDGAVFFATANKGSLGRLEKGFARKGTFVAKAMDAHQIAKWGTIQVDGDAPAGAGVTIATRSGNVDEPDDRTWSSWSKEMPLENGFLPIGSPSGRFLQYRLTLTCDGQASPAVGGVEVVYQVGNLAPAVAGVAVVASEKGASPTQTVGGAKIFRHIDIKAADQNGDKLRFILAFREIGTEDWITITDRLEAPKFIWDTRAVGDGRYELRVTASDDPANPKAAALEASRISDPFVIDNTPPLVKDLAAKVAGTAVSITGLAEDAQSRITSICYALNSQYEWHAVLPSDGICDSGREKFVFEVKDLKPGTYRLAVRATDILDNVGYGAVTFRIGK